MIQWNEINTTHEDMILIGRIVHRASPIDNMSLAMDLEACHSITPLDLLRLFNASAVDFEHDLSGITRHLNRSTGELLDCFVPRYAKA